MWCISFTGSKNKGDNIEITWDNPEELDNYIKKLQKAAERLTTENRRLRKSHFTISEKVCQMMNIDLLRQQQKWKDSLMDIRHLMAGLVQQVMFTLKNYCNGLIIAKAWLLQCNKVIIANTETCMSISLTNRLYQNECIRTAKYFNGSLLL